MTGFLDDRLSGGNRGELMRPDWVINLFRRDRIEPKLETRFEACFVIVLCTLFVAWKYFVSLRDGFLYYELQSWYHSYSAGAVTVSSLQNLCRYPLLSGLEGPVDLTHAGYLSSWPFVLVQKTLFSGSDKIFASRALFCLFYFLSLFSTYQFCRLVRLSRATTLLAIVYLALNERTLESLFTMGTALLGMFWILASLLLLALIVESRSGSKTRYTLYLSLVPFLVLFSYEVYSVVRPLALLYAAILFVYSIRQVIKSELNWKQVLFLSFSLALAIGVFKQLHPGTTFDLSMLRARNETTLGEDTTVAEVAEFISARVRELPLILAPQHHDHFHYWGRYEVTSSWREVTLTLLVTLVALAILSCRNRRALQGFRCQGSYLPFFYLLTMVVVGIVTPLFATTGLRGHRLLIFQVSTVLLSAWILSIVAASLPRRISQAANGVLLLLVFAIAGRQAQILWGWKPPYWQQTQGYFAEVKQLSVLRPKQRVLGEGAGSRLYLCNKAEEMRFHGVSYPDSEVILFGSLLYYSGVFCGYGVEEMIVANHSCGCSEMIASDKKGGLLMCLERVREGDKIRYSWY